ncbi:nuclease [candidate division WWE3 bacterium CG10_big_fil_rev_8_21_14_0_10_32_10]|uniref:Nuclease n=1 Tax=candidate division WWE3 bacterium CG10_big_fil_rev_8_21_14_0_10_32_10 TaxID=1975090 RepID=A0A2H0RA39_UNCKA|nr:MAG: nuclease [candidate division WWE3 bacterium CG10_big_fil_rev_8_21_14_0_10_32_10]
MKIKESWSSQSKKGKGFIGCLSLFIFFILIGVFAGERDVEKSNIQGVNDKSESQVVTESKQEEETEKGVQNQEEIGKDNETAETRENSEQDYFIVARVVDGDTIEIEGGQKVRYIGIDTPETVHPDKGVECYGKEASDKNKTLVENKKIRLEKDVSETDSYGRLLRYIYLEDGTFVNLLLVKEGFARSSTYPPDVKHQETLKSAEQEARASKIGLWASDTCSGTTTQVQPNTTNQNQTNTPQQTNECVIKGNISTNNEEKIYHMPGQQYYDKTVIDTSKGERWFCTELEAINAGWRKSKR